MHNYSLVTVLCCDLSLCVLRCQTGRGMQVVWYIHSNVDAMKKQQVLTHTVMFSTQLILMLHRKKACNTTLVITD